MPRVPKLDELHIGARGIDAPAIDPVQARASEVSTGYDLSRLRQQHSGNTRFDAGRPLQALRFSDEPSRQLAATGQALAAYSDVIRQIGIKQADELDRARVTEAQNQYLSAVLDAADNEQNGWKKRQGRNALPDKDKGSLEAQVFEQLNKHRADILDSLGNERQKQAFAAYVAQEDLRQKQAIQAHVLRESQTWRLNNEEAGISLAGKMIASGDEQERAQGEAKFEQHLAGIGQLQGLSGEALEAARQRYASPYVSAAINERINAGDLQGAAQMLSQYQGYLDAKDSVQLTATYKTAHQTQEARAAAQALYQDGEVDFTQAQVGDPYAAYNQGFVAQTYLDKLVNTESGGNNRARPRDKNGKLLSSAYGRAQFTDGTWMQFGKSARGQALRGGMSDAQWLEMRSDQNAAEAATLWYAEENKRVMNREGIPFNNLTAYLFHFGGAKGGTDLYRAHPDTPLEQVLGKGQINANRDLVARTKTAGGLIRYFAQKMGVKPDNTLPTGQPPARQHYSNAQIKQIAQERFPDNPDMQRTFIDTYTTGRDVDVERQVATYNGHLNRAMDVVFSGGGIEQIAAQDWAALTPEDKNKVMRQRESTYDLEQSILERENLDLFLQISDARQVAKMTEEQIRAARRDLGDKYTQTLLDKKRALEKAGIDSARQMTLEDTVRKNLIFELGVINPWDLKKPEDKQAMAYAEFNIQDSINYHVTQYANAGEPLTREKLIELVRGDVGAKIIEYRKNWRGKSVGKEKHAIFQPPTHGLYQDRNKIGMWRTDY